MAVFGLLVAREQGFVLAAEVVSNTHSNVRTAVRRNTTSPCDYLLEQRQVETYRSRGSPNFL